MWIALIVLAAIAALIAVIWSLPVRVLIYNDDRNDLNLRYKFLFKTFGEDPNPDDPIVKMLKTISGVDRLKKNTIKESIQSDGLQNAVTESYGIVIDLLREILSLLRYGTITRLHVKIRCTGEDASRAAIHYGQCCAATSALLNVLHGLVKVRKRGRRIDVGCDYFSNKPVFRYDIVLNLRFGRVLSGFWRVAMAEVKRTRKEETQEK